jgi:hypothetical protein
LLSLPPDARIAEIKRLLEQQAAEQMRNFVARRLKDEDLSAIADWMQEIVKRRESEILNKVPSLREQVAGIDDPNGRLLYLMRRLGAHREVLRPTEDDIAKLKTRLSPEARKDLEKAQQEGRLGELAEQWMRAALFSQWLGPPVDREQLVRFYKEELDPREREYLESLPSKQMQFELMRRFNAYRFQQRFPEAGGPRGRGFGGRGRGPWLRPGERKPSREGPPFPSPAEKPKSPPRGDQS